MPLPAPVGVWLWLFASLLACSCFLLSACDSPTAPDCLKSTGHTATEQRPVSNLQSIVLTDNINLDLYTSDTEQLSITAGKNLLPEIASDQQGSVVTLANNNTCNAVRSYARPVNARYQGRTLNDIRLLGFGDITGADTLRSPGFGVKMYGAGTINLNLVTRRLDLDLNGLGAITLNGRCRYLKLYELLQARAYLNGLITDSAEVHLDGENDVYVNCSRYLHVHLRGTGNLYYSGNPELHSIVTGTGKVIKQ